jgi:GNAT superfamily N-acetyltransferase
LVILVTPSVEEETVAAIPRPSVRAATVADAAGLSSVHVRSWQAAYRGLLPQDYLDGLDQTFVGTERWQGRLRATDWSKAGVVVAVPGRELVGFARFGPSRDDDDDSAIVGEIISIYVIPEAWGRGLGKRLMATALAGLTTAGYGQATLWVLDTNARAMQFYERGGWTPDGATKRSDRWGFPLQEVRYRRQLP